MTNFWSLYLGICFCALIQRVVTQPCDISGGRNELILDVSESIGKEYNQTIEPRILPIEGNPGADIQLELTGSVAERFVLERKSLRLSRPLDRDADDQSTLLFEIICHVRGSSQRRNIPVVLRIQDLNDNAPRFVGAPYEVTLKEDVSGKSPIFKGIRAEDLDSRRNGQVEYKILEVKPKSGSELFKIRFPHQGVVFLEGQLDYETSPVYYITIVATDYAINPDERLNSSTVLTVRVEDVDDQDPAFDTASQQKECPKTLNTCLPEYRSTITEGEVTGVLDIYPNRVHAKDLDSLQAQIIYSLDSGIPTVFPQFFDIDQRTGVVTQKQAVDTSRIKEFNIIIQAMERTARRGQTKAKLTIVVKDVDTSPPIIVIPSYTGKVPEGSKPGTPVLTDDGSNKPFAILVTDPDFVTGEAPPNYLFELTTSAFKVTKEGALVVATPDLDRDPPSLPEHTFQVIAREDREGGGASSPVTVTVKLLDINDNPPVVPVLPTIRVPAGASKRNVLKLRGSDKDEGGNAIVRYRLLNGEKHKFTIDGKSGDVFANGELKAGEEFFLTFEARDSGNLSTEGFVKIVVSRGPNTNGPIFTQSRYFSTIPENIPYGGSVVSVKANDPDGDVSYYSILDGDHDKVFALDTLTGLITVVAPLDRERNDQYHLLIAAEDSERKNNTAAVNIVVTDINDESPTFVGEPYSFRIDEGLSNVAVGKVLAEDKDLAKFGQVSYLIEGGKSQFLINSVTGELSIISALDYEKEQVHYINVVAHDMAKDMLSSTTTVTVLVNDVSDEYPVFEQPSYTIRVPEGEAIGSLLLTVVAKDPDTKPSVTYKMIQGNSSLFKVAPDSGRVSVVGKLDFENENKYTLIIGTEEGLVKAEGSQTEVEININDVNDEPPVLKPLHTTTFPRNAPLQTLLVNVSASDADGTKPNNEISFALDDGQKDAVTYFRIDEEKGEIRLKNTLSDTNITEMRMRIIAMDKGEPPLSTSEEFRILILDEVSAGRGAGGSLHGAHEEYTSLVASPRFPKDYFQVEVKENVEPGSVLVKVPLINATTSIACSITEGNEEGMFIAKVTGDGFCKIISAKVLDYEINSSFNLTLALHPSRVIIKDIKEGTQPILSTAFIQLSVVDMNDNSPSFLLKDVDTLMDSHNTVLSYALQTYPVDSKIIQLEAIDFDAGEKGQVQFKLLPESNRGNYFKVDAKSGLIYTKRRLINVPLELLPFNLSLIAQDQPGLDGTQNSNVINVMIPVIEEPHRAVLLIDAPKANVDERINSLKQILSQYTGKKAQIEFVKPGVSHGIKTSTEVWFHLLEPDTLQPVVPQILNGGREKMKFLKNISSSVEGIVAVNLTSAFELYQSLEDKVANPSVSESEVVTADMGRIDLMESIGPIEFVLLVLGCVIVLFVICAIIVICVLWSKFSKKWNKADKTLMLIPPIIERPSSILEADSKEYEVQVLHMSVPMDEEMKIEAQLENQPQKTFCLDNVAYISKSQSSSSTGSSGQGTPRVLCGGNRWSPETPTCSTFNPYAGEYAAPEPSHGYSASATNANVIFGRVNYPEPSPVETTTEL